MGDSNPVNQEVQNFNKQSLKKTVTKESQPKLPTKEEIEEEKRAAKEGNN